MMTAHGWRASSLGVAVLVGGVLVVVSDDAAGDAQGGTRHWKAPEEIVDRTHEVSGLQTAAGPRRYAVTAWRTPPVLGHPGSVDTVPSDVEDEGKLVASVREPGGDLFGPPRVLGRLGPNDIGVLGISTDGQTVLVWKNPNGRVLARFRTPTGRWTAPQVVVDHDIGGFSLSVAFDGTAIVEWTEGTFPQTVTVAVREPNGQFGEPETVVDAWPGKRSSSTAGTGGRGAVIMNYCPENSQTSIMEPAETGSLAWGTAEEIPNSRCPRGDIVAAFDYHGDMAVSISGHRWGGIRAALRPAGGPFAPAELISERGRRADDGQLVMSGPGRTVVVWEAFWPRVVQASVRPADGDTFSPPHDLKRDGSLLDTAGTRAGHVAVLSQGFGPQRRFHINYLCPGQWFRPPEQATPPMSRRHYVTASVALNPRGSPLVVWGGPNDGQEGWRGVYVAERRGGSGCPPPPPPADDARAPTPADL